MSVRGLSLFLEGSVDSLSFHAEAPFGVPGI